jgi:hypothetical protein
MCLNLHCWTNRPIQAHGNGVAQQRGRDLPFALMQSSIIEEGETQDRTILPVTLLVAQAGVVAVSAIAERLGGAGRRPLRWRRFGVSVSGCSSKGGGSCDGWPVFGSVSAGGEITARLEWHCWRRPPALSQVAPTITAGSFSSTSGQAFSMSFSNVAEASSPPVLLLAGIGLLTLYPAARRRQRRTSTTGQAF